MLLSERRLGVVLGYCSIVLRNVIGLLLIPFIIHHVGISHYGVYSLVTALSGYLIILELGLANTTIRFISTYRAKDEMEKESQFIGVILAIYAVITLVVLSLGAIIWFYIPTIFAQSLTLAEIALLKPTFAILLINIAITLMGNSFTGIISSYERFTFQKGMEIFIFLLRCFLVVVALQLDYGVFAIIMIDTMVNALHTVFRVVFVRRVLAVKIRFTQPDKTTLKEIFSYSFFIALNVIVNQINWRVDTLIIGTLTNTKALGIFNIGSQLVFSFIAFASAISNIFTPKIVKMVALKTSVKLLTDEMIKIGRLQLFVLGYVLVVFMVFGRLFIQLFVGDEFELAYWVALIPMVPFMFVLAQTSTNAVLQALNKHKIRSLLLLFTAVLNIVFSILLVKEMGMLGASIGTALTLFIGELVLVNIYLIKVIKLDMLRFYKELIISSLPVMLCTIAFAIYFSQYASQTWFGLILSCSATALVYLVFTYSLSLSKVERNTLNQRFKIKSAG